MANINLDLMDILNTRLVQNMGLVIRGRLEWADLPIVETEVMWDVKDKENPEETRTLVGYVFRADNPQFELTQGLATQLEDICESDTNHSFWWRVTLKREGVMVEFLSNGNHGLTKGNRGTGA